MIILGTNSIKATGGFNVANSCRFNRADSAILSKTFSGDGTHHDKGTISLWIKRNELGAEEVLFSAGASGREFIRFETNDTLTYRSVTEGYHLNTNRVFRDISAWYHIVVAFDSSQGTSSNRQKIYVNGVQETSFATETYTPNQNMDHKLLSGELNTLGKDSEQNAFAACYFCEVVGIDGQALTPTSFGEFDEDSNIWKPKDVSGLTFGTNGFYLEFKESGTSQNASGLGADTSGNTNHFAVNNLTAIDQSTDTCTNNFATFNPLVAGSGVTFAEGNLAVGCGTVGTYNYSVSTIGVNKGKWYLECKVSSSPKAAIGIVFDGDTGNVFQNIINDKPPGNNSYGWGYKPGNAGAVEHNGANITFTPTATADENDVIGVALDLDNDRLYFSKNGTFLNNGNTQNSTGAIDISSRSGFVFIALGDTDTTNTTTTFNFGSPPYAISSGNTDGDGYGNFEYAVPSGYFSLNTKNLAEYG